MDALTLAQIFPERCTWPCYIAVTRDLTIILAVLTYLLQHWGGHKSNRQ